MNIEEEKLLLQCRSACSNNPHLLSSIIQVCTDGIEEKSRVANERAADFEVIAALFQGLVKEKRLTAETKAYFNDTICNKLDKWENKSALNWKDKGV